ncbi:APC family permease [Clostridium neuense]|uniref:APC family permease n=1 Tax=Clostridium neuense TaxID=1728934 RepID=A0ABW8TKS4_9CLOT
MEKLKKDNLSIIETVALSVAIIAPTASMSLNISLMAKTDKFSSPLVFLISTIIVGIVSYSVIKFNTCMSTAGSLYTFTKEALGRRVGFISGWSLLFAYMALAAGCSAGAGAFTSKLLLSVFGIHVGWLPLSIVISMIMIILGITDAKISTRIMLTMEGISILLILALSIVIIFKVAFTKGLTIAPFKLNGVKTSAIASTSVLAFLSFIGFESASSLGEETKEPHKCIPIAIGSAVFVTGVFYLLSSYAQVIGFGLDAKGLKAITASTLPLSDLAGIYASKGFGTLLILSASLSFFSCALGSVCAGARMLFSMSRDGLMHKSMKKVNRRYNTPYVALILIVTVDLIGQILFFNKDGIDVFSYYGTIGSLAILVSYIFTSVGAIVYFTKKKIWNALHLIIPILGIVSLLYVLWSSIYPIPEFPQNLFPYIVLAWIVLGVILSKLFSKKEVYVETDKQEELIVENAN